MLCPWSVSQSVLWRQMINNRPGIARLASSVTWPAISSVCKSTACPYTVSGKRVKLSSFRASAFPRVPRLHHCSGRRRTPRRCASRQLCCKQWRTLSVSSAFSFYSSLYDRTSRDTAVMIAVDGEWIYLRASSHWSRSPITSQRRIGRLCNTNGQRR